MEELAFRGFFVLKKWFLIIPIALTLLFSFKSNFPLFLILIYLATYFLFFYLYQRKASTVYKVTFILLNSLLFALIHYSLKDLLILDSYFMILIQFGAGLILVWITINFGLMKSILIHGVFNLLVTLPLIIPIINFSDQEVNVIENDVYIIKWQEASSFKIQKNYRISKYSFEGKNITVKQFFEMYDVPALDKFNDVVKWKGKDFLRYNINVKVKDTSSSIIESYIPILYELETRELIEIENKLIDGP